MRPRTKLLVTALAGTASLAFAMPARAQDAPASILPPGFGNAPSRPVPATATNADAAAPTPAAAGPPVSPNADEAIAVTPPSLLPSDIADLAAAEIPQPEEIPDS